jgi:hypothetical protein
VDGEALPTVGAAEIDVEAVAALEPDLIVGIYSFMDEATYELLSGIAPTVTQTGEVSLERLDLLEQDVLVGATWPPMTPSSPRPSASAARCPCRTCWTSSCRRQVAVRLSPGRPACPG